MLHDLRRHEPNPPDIRIAIFLTEPEPAREMIAHDVAVEQRDLSPKLL